MLEGETHFSVFWCFYGNKSLFNSLLKPRSEREIEECVFLNLSSLLFHSLSIFCSPRQAETPHLHHQLNKPQFLASGLLRDFSWSGSVSLSGWGALDTEHTFIRDVLLAHDIMTSLCEVNSHAVRVMIKYTAWTNDKWAIIHTDPGLEMQTNRQSLRTSSVLSFRIINLSTSPYSKKKSKFSLKKKSMSFHLKMFCNIVTLFPWQLNTHILILHSWKWS